ncbi:MULTISPECIES: hypothetical protein [Bifidobacterium]|uniref:hypothetical protein n=1 Tax=Bifidobacterium TaxID=1678 RepID=UPI002354ADD6|nr:MULTISPECIES: hypothetical protein [Bifidobacterium]MCI1218222.1 hypothetical protein [Bifidobacterium crudilactis]
MLFIIILVVTAVGILVVLAVVARVLGHPLFTRTYVNGSLVDVDFWNRKEAENDEEFEGRTSGTKNGVTGIDIDDAGEVDTAGIFGEAGGPSTAVRRWDVEKSVRGKGSERVSEGCGEESHGESAVSGCGDDDELRTPEGIRIITRRPGHGVTAVRRVHGYLTKWNQKYNVYTGREGLWNEKFGEEYKD